MTGYFDIHSSSINIVGRSTAGVAIAGVRFLFVDKVNEDLVSIISYSNSINTEY